MLTLLASSLRCVSLGRVVHKNYTFYMQVEKQQVLPTIYVNNGGPIPYAPINSNAQFDE